MSSKAFLLLRERCTLTDILSLRPTARDMEKVWSEIKVLIVPSLWLEAWGIVVIEAQIRGIPVISSDAGGIPEAKLQIPHIIPVKSITGERTPEDGYVIPEQDIEPWEQTLTKLMTERAQEDIRVLFGLQIFGAMVGRISLAEYYPMVKFALLNSVTNNAEVWPSVILNIV